jgi:hypothetical protein
MKTDRPRRFEGVFEPVSYPANNGAAPYGNTESGKLTCRVYLLATIVVCYKYFSHEVLYGPRVELWSTIRANRECPTIQRKLKVPNSPTPLVAQRLRATR